MWSLGAKGSNDISYLSLTHIHTHTHTSTHTLATTTFTLRSAWLGKINQRAWFNLSGQGRVRKKRKIKRKKTLFFSQDQKRTYNTRVIILRRCCCLIEMSNISYNHNPKITVSHQTVLTRWQLWMIFDPLLQPARIFMKSFIVIFLTPFY